MRGDARPVSTQLCTATPKWPLPRNGRVYASAAVRPGFIRAPMGGWEQLRTRAGKTIRVEVTEVEISIVIDAADGQAVAHATIPSPADGLGGYELVLSAEERYLALFLFSGQSEVGYEVFSLRP